MTAIKCSVCDWEAETGRKVDTSMSSAAWGEEVGVHRTSITRHLGHAKLVDDTAAGALPKGDSFSKDEKGKHYAKWSAEPWGKNEFDAFLLEHGDDPEAVTYGYGWTSSPQGGVWNKIWNVRPIADGAGEPEWPVIQQVESVVILPPVVAVTQIHRGADYNLAIKAGDTQIGFRVLPDGTLDPFHDLAAMAVFVETVRLYQPEKITILGDFLDLPSQSRWAQEASFARTTQLALNAGYLWLAEIRAAAPNAEIVIIEGNHDLRMQNFIQNNALAAFGLKRADMPASWPVMSLPYLLRLEELDIRYVDAYPAATDWDNDRTRNIHGTRSNSKGSTTSQYSQELPHISSWVGHTHRTEITFKTVLGERGLPIETYTANPGCLCRTDGSVPSVHGGIGSDGVPVKIVEDWQQGIGFLWFNETESIPQVYRIHNGRAIIDGRLIQAPAYALAA